MTSIKFLVLVLDIQNSTVISTSNFHSYSNAKVIKKQAWLKVQLWSTSILQLPHLNNSEQSLGIKCDLQTWVVFKHKYAISTYSNIVKVVGQCGGCIGKEEHITGTDESEMIEAANTVQLLLPNK